MHQYAVLDLGSYNFQLLIAEFEGFSLNKILEHTIITELANGIDNNKQLSTAYIHQVAGQLQSFIEPLQTINKNNIRIIGTGALRQASNAADFISLVNKFLPINVEIISGQQEAEYTFMGASYELNLSEPALIIDIGGGSSEIIVGQQQARIIHSLEIGGLSCAKRYFSDEPLCEENYQLALQQVRQKLQVTAKDVSSQKWQKAIGASGIIRSIKAILQHYCDCNTLNLSSIEQLVNKLIEQGSCDFITTPEHQNIKAELLPGGLVILHAMMLELGIDKLETTTKSVREGVIYSMYQEQQPKVQHG